MNRFRYRGIDVTGESVAGVIEAPDCRQVLQKLKFKKVRPLAIISEEEKAVKSNTPAFPFLKRISSEASCGRAVNAPLLFIS